ncbi:TniQ family protein [Rhizobium sp. CECT 9324]|uniref:TniQ family protein n=1 Tax=Rhizobium sp. CECT 9324 TaxID=2845820 RepID=UPI001E443A1F|nr:TniQ family protein [Rhizobium sp. CECT 9324]CAH0340492.1 hypothetical protein RHI9324_02160 [Rhizobium sp. CECT 9324]
MSRLAITVPLNEDETLSSFCSRIASANGIGSAREFCFHMRLDYKKLNDGTPDAIGHLARLTGQDHLALEASAIVRNGDAYYIRGNRFTKGQILRGRVRFCPCCLEDDYRRQTGYGRSRPYGRILWSLSSVLTCPIHDVFLCEGNDPFGAQTGYDFIQMLADTVAGDPMLSPRLPGHGEFDKYVSDRLVKGRAVHDWIDSLPLHVVSRVTEHVGGMLLHGLKFNVTDLDVRQRLKAMNAGFAVMAPGKAAFVEYLRSHHQRIMEGMGDFGGRKLYGRLYEAIGHGKLDPDFDTIRKIMIDTTIDHLPIGPGDNLFGPVERRKWHSVHSASRTYGIHYRPLTRYVAAAGIATEDLTADRILVDVATMDAIAASIKQGLTPPEARKMLNVNLATWGTLLQNGIFSPITPDGTTPRFARGDLQGFLDMLTSKATESFSGKSDLVNLMTARRMARCTVAEVVELMREGALARVSVNPDKDAFQAIYLDSEELKARVRGAEVGGIPVYKAYQELKMSHSTITKLSAAGIIPTFRAKHPENRNLQTFITPEAIEEFRRKYVSLFVLAEQRGLNVRKLKYALKAAGIEPALTREQHGASFYLVEDVEKAL